MAIVDTGLFFYPPMVPYTGDTPQINTSLQLMNAATERLGVVFMAPRSGTINRVAIRLGANTFNVASVLRVSLQDVVNSSGIMVPDGTQDQYRDITSLVTNQPLETGLLTSDGTDGGTKRTVTIGDMLAIVMEYQTFTTGDAVRQGILVAPPDGGYFEVNNFASPVFYNGSSWSAQSNTALFAVEYQTLGWVPVHPYAFVPNALGSDLIRDNEEAGNRLQMPFKCRVVGVAALVESGAAATLKVYDNSEVEIAEGIQAVPEAGTATDSIEMMLDAPLTLEADTNYFFVWRGESGNDIRPYRWTHQDAKWLAVNPWGPNWRHAIRSNHTVDSFTVSTTEVHPMHLILSGMEVS